MMSIIIIAVIIVIRTRGLFSIPQIDFLQPTPWMETNEGSRFGAVVGQRIAQEFGVGALGKSKCVCGFSMGWNLDIHMIFLP